MSSKRRLLTKHASEISGNSQILDFVVQNSKQKAENVVYANLVTTNENGESEGE